MDKPKVVDVKVNWSLGWDNNPTLRVLLDREPDPKDFRFEKSGGFYYAVFGDAVRFFFHSGEPEVQEGYGGLVMKLKMRDGSLSTLVGPWSSRAGAVNAVGFAPCVDVEYTAFPRVFRDEEGFYSGHVTLSSIQRWMVEHPEINWKLVKAEVGCRSPSEDIRWDPRLKGVPYCSRCKGFKKCPTLFGPDRTEVPCEICQEV